MKRLLLLTLAIVTIVTCAHKLPMPSPTVTLYAFTVPSAKTISWSPNPASDNVTMYTLKCDAGTNIATDTLVAPSSCSATTCSRALTINTFGAHTCSLFAMNLDLSGANTQGTSQNSPTVTLPFALNQDPTAPAGLGVK